MTDDQVLELLYKIMLNRSVAERRDFLNQWVKDHVIISSFKYFVKNEDKDKEDFHLGMEKMAAGNIAESLLENKRFTKVEDPITHDIYKGKGHLYRLQLWTIK